MIFAHTKRSLLTHRDSLGIAVLATFFFNVILLLVLIISTNYENCNGFLIFFREGISRNH